MGRVVLPTMRLGGKPQQNSTIQRVAEKPLKPGRYSMNERLVTMVGLMVANRAEIGDSHSVAVDSILEEMEPVFK